MDKIEIKRVIKAGFDWANQDGWRWTTASEALREVGVIRPNRADATSAAVIIRSMNKNTARRSNGKSLLMMPKLSGRDPMMDPMIGLEIDKNIPIPLTNLKYPFNRMDVGDSFFFDGKSMNPVNAAHVYGKNNNKRFVSKLEREGRRVWRVA